MKEFFVFGVCLGGMAVTFLTLGILTRLGYLRAMYALKGHLVIAPPSLVYGLIPLVSDAMNCMTTIANGHRCNKLRYIQVVNKFIQLVVDLIIIGPSADCLSRIIVDF